MEFVALMAMMTALVAYLIVSFFCIGLLFGNLNAMAMQPLGHAAGTGAPVVGALATFTSLGLGALVCLPCLRLGGRRLGSADDHAGDFAELPQ